MKSEKNETKVETILDNIQKRRSVRKYKSTEIPDTDIKKIMEAVATAPSAGNQQPCKFIITQDLMVIKKLKDACINASMSKFITQNKPSEEERNIQLEKRETYYKGCFSAPVYITVLTDKNSKFPSYNHFDGPLAAATLMLAANAYGYGTVFYVDTIPESVTRAVLNIPDNYERVCFTPLGIPAEWPEQSLTNEVESVIIKDLFKSEVKK